MSMSTCKCDKIFDTDHEMNTDEKGECCCDNCYCEMYDELKNELMESIEAGFSINDGFDFDYITECLMDLGYRKVK